MKKTPTELYASRNTDLKTHGYDLAGNFNAMLEIQNFECK